jgi:thiamine biosynthesis lipoprotein
MGTAWRIHHSGGVTGEDAQAVADLVGADERRWSRFTSQSDVARINGGAGRPVEVAEETMELVATALAWSRRTDGVFAPLVGARLAGWGYHRRLGDATSQPGPGAVPDSSGIELDVERRTVQIPAGTLLDLGGIGKSWSGVRAGALLAERVADRRLIIDAGGDLAIVRGTHTIATVAGPIRAEAGEGVATSSSERRSWDIPAGGRAHHLIDPATGDPGALGTAVVAGTDPVAADVLASCLVMRPALLETIAAAAARRDVDGVTRTNDAWLDRTVAP